MWSLHLKLRENNYKVDFDMQAKKFSKQLEKASKVANKAIILGEDEINNSYYSVKNLSTGEQTKVESFEEL